jgi:four helix bundle protein
MRGYKDLEVWKRLVSFALSLYKAVVKFPPEEKYGLASQMRRAVVSIPSNIAEGARRQHSAEYRQFVHIALGSGAELQTQILIASELEFIPPGKKDLLFSEL